MQVNLVYFKPDGGRKDISLDKANVVIGRRPDCDVRVPVSGVSRQHCELVAADDTLKVRDLDSSNGTYVNGERVTEQPVTAGDRIQVGPVVLTVQINGEPADVAPPKPEAKPKASTKPKAKAKPESDAAMAGDEDDIFAQMLMEDDEDEDEDEDNDEISALDLLEDEH